jgi:LuxR family maltose regulon positive regulatory protein
LGSSEDESIRNRKSQIANRVAWLSLDEGDSDPARFLAYLIAALQTVDTDMGTGALSALQSPQSPPVEAVLTSLINEIARVPDRMVLVLDDYHLIEAQEIHDALSFLLERIPPQMHVVIASREDPPLPLARLRARGQLTELRAIDLRFSPSEATEFLNQLMRLDLSAEEIAALDSRTEGWIAGLQMAALALQGTPARQGRASSQGAVDASSRIESFTGSHRYVLDYLIEEVFVQQSESVQAFLLQTAILKRLTGSLCDAVRFGPAEAPSSSSETAVRFGRAKAPSSSSGTAVRFGGTEAPSTPGGDAVHSGTAETQDGQATLEMLERANLFVVPLDEERRWYRYHHLFADLLRRRLHQTQPAWVPTLHLRASEWYEQRGYDDEAIEHALQAGEFQRAARLIEKDADALWGRGEHAKLRHWLAALPLEMACSRPELCVYHTWYLFLGGQQEAAERTLQVAEQAITSSTDDAKGIESSGQGSLACADRMKLQGRVAAVRAFMVSYQGDVAGIIRHAGKALEYLPEKDRTWRSICAMVLGDAHGFKGDMAAAYEARFEALKACQATGDTYYVMLAGLKLAITLRAQGRLRQTLELCQEQMQLANEYGLAQTSLYGLFLAIQGEVLAEFDDLDGAIDRANKGMLLAGRSMDLAMLGWGYMCLARILYSRGEYAAITRIVEEVEATARESNVPVWIMSQMAVWQARVWLAQDKLEAAYRWARTGGLIATGEPKPPHELDFFRLMEYIVRARILIAQERLDEAMNLLQPLLEAAESGDRTTRVIEILNLQALTLQAGGETARAVNTLARALSLAEPEGFVRAFVEEGPPMARLLYEAAARGIAPDYAGKLLAAFEATTKDQGPRTKDKGERSFPSAGPSTGSGGPSGQAVRPLGGLGAGSSWDPVEPLSERELEVLQLIAKGLSNREIAARLVLSLNTVKAHTRNIYGKLEVHSRTQAIVRGRAFGLLPRE